MKIGVVGCGMVGSTSAYALVMSGVGREIVLVDVNRARAEAEANDIYHAVPFAHPLTVRAGGVCGPRRSARRRHCRRCGAEAGRDAFAVAATQRRRVPADHSVGAPRRSRRGAPHRHQSVDVMTHLAALFAADFDVPHTRVFGSGTTLDTARFRALLGRHFDVDPQHVHAYVIGEHGDSEVLVWSQATIAGLSLDEFVKVHGTPLTGDDRRNIDENVRRAAYQIIAGKGSTYYGIGSAVARIVDVLLHDQRAILTICSRITDVPDCDGVTLALPHLVSGDGILTTIPLALDATEREGLRGSADVLREAIVSLKVS